MGEIKHKPQLEDRFLYSFEKIIDLEKTVDTKCMPEAVRAGELPPEIIEMINYKKQLISKPFNLKHEIHIVPDPNEPMGLRGLPLDWLEKMQKSGLKK